MAVFLDADGTLVNHEMCEKQALVHMFTNIGIAYKNMYQEIFRPLDYQLWDSAADGTCPVSGEEIPVYRFKCLFERIGVQYNDCERANELFKEGLANSTALIENAVELVTALCDMGLILCVVTNGLVQLQKPRVVNSEIGRFISHIIVSEEVGAHKPNPLIFNELLGRLGLDADNVIMLGDSLKNDVQGAKNAGIKSIWFNPGRIINETAISPDYEIHNLLDAVGVIKQVKVSSIGISLA